MWLQFRVVKRTAMGKQLRFFFAMFSTSEVKTFNQSREKLDHNDNLYLCQKCTYRDDFILAVDIHYYVQLGCICE